MTYPACIFKHLFVHRRACVYTFISRHQSAFSRVVLKCVRVNKSKPIRCGRGLQLAIIKQKCHSGCVRENSIRLSNGFFIESTARNAASCLVQPVIALIAYSRYYTHMPNCPLSVYFMYTVANVIQCYILQQQLQMEGGQYVWPVKLFSFAVTTYFAETFVA